MSSTVTFTCCGKRGAVAVFEGYTCLLEQRSNFLYAGEQKLWTILFSHEEAQKAQNVSADFVQFVFFVALLLHFTEVLRYFLRLLLRLTW